MWRKEHLKWSAWWEVMGDFEELGSSGISQFEMWAAENSQKEEKRKERSSCLAKLGA